MSLGYLTGAYSAFLDFSFALYPIPFVMQLNISLKSRIGVSVALALSVLGCIPAIYKLVLFKSVFDIFAVDATCEFDPLSPLL